MLLDLRFLYEPQGVGLPTVIVATQSIAFANEQVAPTFAQTVALDMSQSIGFSFSQSAPDFEEDLET